MSGMAEVLAAHQDAEAPTGGRVCICGEWEGPWTGSSFAAHQAAMLAAAGFGPVKGAANLRRAVTVRLAHIDGTVPFAYIPPIVTPEAAPCHICGRADGFMASAWGADKGQRFFCHNDERSCYNDARGRYFDD